MRKSSLQPQNFTRPKIFNKWLLVACLLLLAVAVGFHFGQRVQVSQTATFAQFEIVDDWQSNATSLELDSHALSSALHEPPTFVSAAAIELETNTENASATNKNRKFLLEIEYLSSAAGRLRKRVASLEWETLTLESDLLASEIELENALSELAENRRQRRDVYNITNVPVGGYVAPAPKIETDVVQALQRSKFALAVPPVSAILQQDFQEDVQENVPERIQERIQDRQQQKPFQQRLPAQAAVFYGPGLDRYENLVNPGIAQTPYEALTQDESLINNNE